MTQSTGKYACINLWISVILLYRHGAVVTVVESEGEGVGWQGQGGHIFLIK